MCSIAGIIDFHKKDKIDLNLALRMSETMKKRGPDDKGIDFGENFAFCHNRLSVMDLENGHQPMVRSFMGKRYVIVYNGEIYNMDELKRDLIRSGFTLKTTCDTEILLLTYIKYREKTPEKLNGIFAFAIYDEEKDIVFMARDRFGIKPFFYNLTDTTFIFASEIKALLAHPNVSRKIEKDGLWDLLFLSPVRPSGRGIFRDVKELPPSYYATFSKDGLKKECYFKLEAKKFSESRIEAIEHTKYLLTDAINRQLRCDVPLATLLSGGIDSSIISSVAARNYGIKGKTLSTYSFEYEGNKENFGKTLFQPESDDAYAILMADYIGSNHSVLTAPTGLLASYLLNATVCRDMPGQADIDSSLYYFCKMIRKNHTVTLSGECSDEIFGGYPWFYRSEMLHSGYFPWIHEPLSRPNLFKDEFSKKDEGLSYAKGVYEKAISDYSYLDTDSEEDKLARCATHLSTSFFMTSLLERKDRMSMASSLEVRVPFADHRILEYVYNVPWKYKFENGVEKSLLRNAMAEFLPDEILYRKKSPYPKTHNPEYEKAVLSMLSYRLKKGGILTEVLNKDTLSTFLKEENTTWFGQLMARPQLIAWLIQFDYFCDYYSVEFI